MPSFTRLGYAIRSRLEHWTPLDAYHLEDRVMVVTGATSGLGRATAAALASQGASVVLLGRDEAKTERVRHELTKVTGNESLSIVIVDLEDMDEVRRAAAELRHRFDRLDALIHNAGALHAARRDAPDGTEATVAGQVVGPFLLTGLLLDQLRAAAPGRVLTMSSGGMYTAALTVADLEMPAETFRGTEQYARAKRAQVTLNELWSCAVDARDVVFHAMHPGWADTPGVTASLPTFSKVMGPLLRNVEQGSDTMVWLAADDGRPRLSTGGFWLDRHPRPIHRLAKTRHSDTPRRRAELWSWCVERSGCRPDVDCLPAADIHEDGSLRNKG